LFVSCDIISPYCTQVANLVERSGFTAEDIQFFPKVGFSEKPHCEKTCEKRGLFWSFENGGG
jgi:hypothetical protein